MRVVFITLVVVAICYGVVNERSLEQRDSCPQCYEIPNSGFPSYGVPSGTDGFPNYNERATLVWYNAVRMDPSYFFNTFLSPTIKDSSAGNVFSSGSYPATTGITWNLNLNRAARAHSYDRSTCPSSSEFAHNDCNGTTYTDRNDKFYASWAGEIYWPTYNGLGGSITQKNWPYYSVAGWICDGLMYYDGTFQQCATDSGAGHRQNIMTAGSEVGCGTVFSADGTTVWATCDEGYGQVYTGERIMSASHIFDHTTSNSLYFYASFYHSSETVQSAVVMVDGASYTLSLQSGSSNAGNWKSSSFSTGSGCRTYYFTFTTSSGTYTYPPSGYYSTYGEGSCATDYTAGSAPVTITTAGATTAAATTSTTGKATTGNPTTGQATVTTGQQSTGNTYSSSSDSSSNSNGASFGALSSTGSSSDSSTSTGSATTSTPNLYYGPNLCSVSLVYSGDYSSFDATTFQDEFGNALSITPARVNIQTSEAGPWDSTTQVDFTLYDTDGEPDCESIVNSCFDLLNNGGFSNYGLSIWTFNAWFFTNSGGSVPATNDVNPSVSWNKNGKSSSKSLNTAMIGGIVGGGVALIAIVAIIAFIVIRRRRSNVPGSFF